ncbi:MAG: GntR family transcriptional regulator [Clostridia bacterium]|nr:GntR family transcriptional regulator [Clostridia bacterium]
MHFENHIPIYLQIIELIKKQVILGILKPGDKLESVREFAAEIKVNPNTVQKAYQEMEREGLAYSQRGIGRFIVEDESLVKQLRHDASKLIIEDFISKMTEIGYSNDEILDRLKAKLNGG